MNQSDLAWVAGFIEGEGSIRMQSTLRVRACQVQLWPLEKLKRMCGGTIYEYKTPKGKPYRIWELGGPDAERLAIDLFTLMSPERQKQIWRALIKRKLQPRRGSLANRAQCARAGRNSKGKPKTGRIKTFYAEL